MLMEVSNGPVAVAYMAADIKLTIRTFLDRMINGLS